MKYVLFLYYNFWYREMVYCKSFHRREFGGGVAGWGEGPGVARRLTADEVNTQQQIIIAGRDWGEKENESHDYVYIM